MKKKERIEILKSICIFTIDELMTKIKKRDVRNGRYHVQNCEIEVDSVRYRVSDVDIDVFVSKTGELRIEIPNVECEMFQVKNMEIFVEEGNIRIRVDTLTGTFPLSSLSSVRGHRRARNNKYPSPDSNISGEYSPNSLSRLSVFLGCLVFK